jgi:hypothetical protein
MKRLVSALLLVAAAPLATLSLTGCGTGLSMATPNGFAELEDQQSYDYRATNAEGVVIAVRREDNDPAGDLAFWSGALDAHLRRAGYRAVEAKPVEAVGGMQGKQLRYTIERSGREHVFWLTVFVTESEVITIEAGGDVAFFGGVEKSVTRAIASLNVS